jgi:arsenite-transporting ATPase
MTPDRMVVKEAMRTFTYLNLFGYLTDAVVVNRVFPAEVDGYFDAWREVQGEQLELVESGFAPVPVLRAPYFEREVLGGEMLDRLGAALFADVAAADVLHASLSQTLTHDGERAQLRLELPFVEKADVTLKKIGLELVVRVGDVKRMIQLPATLGGFRPSGAEFADAGLTITFEPVPEAAHV